MKEYITDKPFSEEQLKNMDIIHNSNIKLFEDQNESSCSIENFISENERLLLERYFRSEIEISG